MLAVVDIGALIKIGVFIIIVIGWIVRSIATQAAEKPVQRPRAPQPQPRLPQQPSSDAPVQTTGQRPLDPAEEVAEFLRQAQARRGGPPRQTTPPKPAARPAASTPPIRGQRKAPKPASRPAARKSLAPSDRTTELGQGVGQHVQQHLDTQEFDQRAARPTNVAVAENANEARLQQVFSHRVGTLSDVTMPPPEDAPVLRQPVLNLAALLADGNSLRQMILVSEVLRRPEERW